MRTRSQDLLRPSDAQVREPGLPACPTCGWKCRGWHRFLNRCGFATRGWRESVYPLNRNADGSSPLVPANRAPLPVCCPLDKSCSHRVIVHVVKLLFQLGCCINLERVVLRLPETFPFPKPVEISCCCLAIPCPNVKTRLPLPTMHESAKASCRGKPDDRMDMLRHYHEPDTTGFVLAQFLVEYPQQDSFRVVMVQESRTSTNGKRDEVGVQPVINDLATVLHGTILPDRIAQRFESASPPGSDRNSQKPEPSSS